jgi:hypothetical protein
MADLIQPHLRPLARRSDGTDDLAFGVWLLMFSLMGRLSHGTTVMWRWFAMFYGLIAATWVITHFGIRAIRARLVYRRSGYVRPLLLRPRPWIIVLMGMLVGMIAAALGAYLVKTRAHVVSAPLIVGLLFGLILLAVAVKQRLRRYMGYAVLSIAFGVVLHFLEPGWSQSALVSGVSGYWLLMGIAFLITGAVTLHLFVRRTPPQDLEAE